MQGIPLFDFAPEGAICLGSKTRTLCSDFAWREIGELAIGDELVAFEGQAVKGLRRKMRISTVQALAPVRHSAYRISLADGREIIASSELQWLTDPSSWWMYTRNLLPRRPMRDLGAPWQVDHSWEAGWLAGAFDGEACLSSCTPGSAGSGWHIIFVQNEGAVLDLAERLCKERGYEARRKADAGRKVRRLVITGIYDCMRFLGECRPVRLIGRSKPWIETRTPTRTRGTARARRYNVAVEKVEFLGECDVVATQTSTKTIIAEGLFGSLSYAPMKP